MRGSQPLPGDLPRQGRHSVVEVDIPLQKERNQEAQRVILFSLCMCEKYFDLTLE